MSGTTKYPLPPQESKAFYPLPGVNPKPRPMGVVFYLSVLVVKVVSKDL